MVEDRALRAARSEVCPQTKVAYTVEDHIRLKRVGQIAASPDGTWLAVAVQRLDQEGSKYVSDLWRVPTDGGAAVQLTRGDSKDSAPCFRHDGALGFLSNRKPNEVKADDEADKRMQVWLLPATHGEPQQLTDEPLGVEAFALARDADRLVLLSPVLPNIAHSEQREAASKRAKHGPNARHFTTQPVRHWDHWLHQNPDLAHTHVIAYDASGGQRVDLTPDAKREFDIEPEFDVSVDGRHAVVTRRTQGADRVDDISIVFFDLTTQSSKVLAHAPATIFSAPVFSPDGRSLAVSRSLRSPKQIRETLSLIDVAGGAMRDLATAWDRWPTPAAWSTDGRRLYVTADDEGHVPVFVVNVQTNAVERITAQPSGGSHAELICLRDGRIACVRTSLVEAPECFVVDPVAGNKPVALAPLSGWRLPEWAEVDTFAVKSTDGATIQSFIIKPKNASGPLPALLWIHGGPIGMSGDGWHWRWNPLLAVAAGYAVVETNPRGSTGYGQKFIDGIWGNCWGAQCFEDLMAVTDALERRVDVDRTRIMAMGGSFGGYMSNWIGTQSQRFRCLITHASIVGMATFTGVTDHPGWWYLEMGGENPYKNPEAFDRFAPWKHLSEWKTPTLIIHGELDYRCPIGEALMLFEALQYHGVASELLAFPDENHWIQKPRNIVAWYDTVLGFLKRHMQ